MNTLTVRGGATIVAQGPVILNIAGQAPDPNSGDDSESLITRLDLRDVTIMSAPSANPNPANLLIVYWGTEKLIWRANPTRMVSSMLQTPQSS